MVVSEFCHLVRIAKTFPVADYLPALVDQGLLSCPPLMKKAQFSKCDFSFLIPSDSSIQCVLFSGNQVVKGVSEFLFNSGFDVRPVLSPTVQKGKERIRICLHVFNSNEEIINLANAIRTQISQARN